MICVGTVVAPGRRPPSPYNPTHLNTKSMAMCVRECVWGSGITHRPVKALYSSVYTFINIIYKEPLAAGEVYEKTAPRASRFQESTQRASPPLESRFSVILSLIALRNKVEARLIRIHQCHVSTRQRDREGLRRHHRRGLQ